MSEMSESSVSNGLIDAINDHGFNLKCVENKIFNRRSKSQCKI